MQTTNRLFDDLAKLFVGVIEVGRGLKTDLSQRVCKRFESFTEKHDLVNRNEFEIFAEVAQKARTQSENLEERIAALEENFKKADNSSKI